MQLCAGQRAYAARTQCAILPTSSLPSATDSAAALAPRQHWAPCCPHGPCRTPPTSRSQSEGEPTAKACLHSRRQTGGRAPQHSAKGEINSGVTLPASPGLTEFPLDRGKGTATGFTIVSLTKHPILKSNKIFLVRLGYAGRLSKKRISVLKNRIS